MADTKISALTANATPAFEDLLTTIDDPGGTPASRKTTIEELLTASVAAANTSLFSPTGYSLTGSDASPAIDLVGTWNTTGVPTAIKLNVTDTASDAASLLLDLQVGSASRFAVYKDAGAYFDANLVEFRNSTNAQTFNLYNTDIDASNYERGTIKFDTNVFTIATENAGTGSARNMVLNSEGGTMTLQTGGSARLTINASTVQAAGAIGYVGWYMNALSYLEAGSSTTRIRLYAGAANGQLRLSNTSNNDFDMLLFGGTTSSFPALKKSSTTIQARLADDSAFATLQGQLQTDTNYTASAPTPTGYLVIYDATGTAYKVPAEAL